jgi:hypothetical protein
VRRRGTVLLVALLVIAAVLSAAAVTSLELSRYRSSARKRRERTEAIWLARSAAAAHASASLPGGAGRVVTDGGTTTAVVGDTRVRISGTVEQVGP